jgi:hypothetical protein
MEIKRMSEKKKTTRKELREEKNNQRERETKSIHFLEVYNYAWSSFCVWVLNQPSYILYLEVE